MKVELKKYKKDADHSYCLGVFPTLELLEHQLDQVLGVIVHSRGADNSGVQKIRRICGEHNLELNENDRLVEKLSQRGNTYAIGVFQKFTRELAFDANHLVLVHPSGMGNLGTILRTMVGFDHRQLAVIEPAADIFHPKVIRASMGALFQIRVQTFPQFTDYWGTFSNHALYPLMTDGEVNLSEAAFQQPYSLIFGEEASGLEDSYRQYGTSIVIPHSPAIDSLNIALSVGISLYHAYLAGT